MQEALATKIKCEWCGREIWVPTVVLDSRSLDSSDDKFYCPWCGQYTKIKEEHDLKKFEEEQTTNIDEFEERLIRRIDEKIEEVRILTKAIEEGRLIDFARLGPDEYKKTMKKLCRKTGRKN